MKKFHRTPSANQVQILLRCNYQSVICSASTLKNCKCYILAAYLFLLSTFVSLFSSYNSCFPIVLLVRRSRDRFPVVSLGFFSWYPPTEPCALRLTQPLTVNTGDFSWGKGGRCIRLTTYHPCSAETSR